MSRDMETLSTQYRRATNPNVNQQEPVSMWKAQRGIDCGDKLPRPVCDVQQNGNLSSKVSLEVIVVSFMTCNEVRH